MTLLGSGTVPVLVVLVLLLVVLLPVPRTVKASEGIVPTELFDARDGPSFWSNKPGPRWGQRRSADSPNTFRC